MNLRKMKAALAGLAIVGLVFTGCKGEDGDNGNDGNANVISSSYSYDGTVWANGDLSISVPALSKDIVDNGNVAVYFTFDSLATDTITWNPLPFRFVGNVGGTNTFITISNSFKIGEVTINSRASNNAPINLSFPTSFRVVLIPNAVGIEGVDLDDYEEVKMVYGLEDELDL